MEEQAYLVCMRVDELDDPVEGSTTTACVDCGTDIWVSVESKKVMFETKAMPLCSKCGYKTMQENPAAAIQAIGAPSDGQIAEILGHDPSMMDLARRLKKVAAEQGESLGEWIHETAELDLWDRIKEMATASGHAMDSPHADWGSMCIMEDYDGASYPAVPISEMLHKGVPKQVVAQNALPGLIIACHAKRVIMGLSAFGISTESAEGGQPPEIEGPISEHPDRQEMLVMVEMTADGVQRVAMATITRDGIHPPKLGEWNETEQPNSDTGLFVEAIVPTLALVRQLREGNS